MSPSRRSHIGGGYRYLYSTSLGELQPLFANTALYYHLFQPTARPPSDDKTPGVPQGEPTELSEVPAADIDIGLMCQQVTDKLEANQGSMPADDGHSSKHVDGAPTALKPTSVRGMVEHKPSYFWENVWRNGSQVAVSYL